MLTLRSILSLILANPEKDAEIVTGLINMFKATTAPAPVTVPSTPAVGGNPVLPATKKAPSPVIKDVQTLLNEILKIDPPLVVDGWLGEKTEKAIADGLVMAKPYLAMIGK